jgi:hypothetical protein
VLLGFQLLGLEFLLLFLDPSLDPFSDATIGAFVTGLF